MLLGSNVALPAQTVFQKYDINVELRKLHVLSKINDIDNTSIANTVSLKEIFVGCTKTDSYLYSLVDDSYTFGREGARDGRTGVVLSQPYLNCNDMLSSSDEDSQVSGVIEVMDGKNEDFTRPNDDGLHAKSFVDSRGTPLRGLQHIPVRNLTTSRSASENTFYSAPVNHMFTPTVTQEGEILDSVDLSEEVNGDVTTASVVSAPGSAWSVVMSVFGSPNGGSSISQMGKVLKKSKSIGINKNYSAEKYGTSKGSKNCRLDSVEIGFFTDRNLYGSRYFE